jgi:diadenosine tetraphosphate (Ap4A) HIT family hydrolase
MPACPLCSPDGGVRARVFYESPEWFAFLDAEPLAVGHAVLVRKPTGGCPQGLTREHLVGHDQALADVVGTLRRRYGVRSELKDFLFASLRQQVPHVHTHIVPLWADDEARWRAATGVRQPGMFRFLGWLDQTRVTLTSEEAEAEKAERQVRLAEEARTLQSLP